MFQNIQPARNEDHYYYAGKYHYNKVPHHTEAHRPLESCNRSYNKSNHVRFSKTNTLRLRYGIVKSNTDPNWMQQLLMDFENGVIVKIYKS